MTDVRVLLVEDDDVQAELVESTLGEDEGWDVTRAATVAAARKQLEPGRFDAAIVDYVLPDGDGFDVLETAVEATPDLPVLFLTGHGDEEVALKALSRGAVDYLTKSPDVASELPGQVRRLVEGGVTTGRVELLDDAAGPEGAGGPGDGGIVMADPDVADLDEALDELEGKGVRAMGVFDKHGDPVAVRMPDADVDTLGPVLAEVSRLVGRMVEAAGLEPRSHLLLAKAQGGLVGASIVPGPLLVILVLPAETPSKQAAGILEEASRRLWEAAGGPGEALD